MDLEYGEACDILTPMGFCNALYMTMQLLPGRACFTAPVCSTWVYMCFASMQCVLRATKPLECFDQVTWQHRPQQGVPLGVAKVHFGDGCQPDGWKGHDPFGRGNGFEGMVGIGATRELFGRVAPFVPRAPAPQGLGGQAEDCIHATLWCEDTKAHVAILQPLPIASGCLARCRCIACTSQLKRMSSNMCGCRLRPPRDRQDLRVRRQGQNSAGWLRDGSQIR